MDTKSLEERASEWAKWQMSERPYPENGTKEQKEMWQMSYDACIEDYKDIAKEQCEIDIQRACKWLYDNLGYGFMETNNFISKFKQTMKGE